MMVNAQSTFRPFLIERGSCGRSGAGGLTTNWKRKVVSPTTIFPRALSSSLIRWASRSSACGVRSAASSLMPESVATLPDIASVKRRWHSPATHSNSLNSAGRPAARTTNIALSPLPTTTGLRPSSVRSSSIRPRCITPTRSTFGPVGRAARITAVIWPDADLAAGPRFVWDISRTPFRAFPPSWFAD